MAKSQTLSHPCQDVVAFAAIPVPVGVPVPSWFPVLVAEWITLLFFRIMLPTIISKVYTSWGL